jgi:hypothetical protein
MIRLCLANGFVTSLARRGEGKASVRKSLEAYYPYVEDDLWTGNAAIADASPYAVEAICQIEPSSLPSRNGPFILMSEFPLAGGERLG